MDCSQSGVNGYCKRKINIYWIWEGKYKIIPNNRAIFNQISNIRKAYFEFCKVLWIILSYLYNQKVSYPLILNLRRNINVDLLTCIYTFYFFKNRS